MLKLKPISLLLLSGLTLFVLVGALASPGVLEALASSPSSNPSTTAPRYTAVCLAAARALHCDAFVFTSIQRRPLVRSRDAGPMAGSYGPAQFHIGYNLPCSVGGTSAQAVCAKPTGFGKQTIAIVDTYNAPTIQADLNTYDSYYGLPTCTTANGCLSIVNENGKSSPLPAADSRWALEISLDVETAHEICQTCKLLLVEASAPTLFDLGTAVNTAARLGATEISNSYGGSETFDESSYDGYYNHAGIAVTASSGDGGYMDGFGVEYPAASPYVVSVGGTTLNLNSNNTYLGESVWGDGGFDSAGAGSGCSMFENANPWQTSVADWSLTQCKSYRATADVSADADPYTGAAVYDSTPYGGQSGWFLVGGTSLASPLIAGVFALAGGTPSYANVQRVPYLKFNSANSHDVTSGSNGYCNGTIMCRAAAGYDGPTGLGTPNGTSGF